MATVSGKASTRKPFKMPSMRFMDPSDPIYLNPTMITFVPSTTTSSPDSEIPELGKPGSASPEPSVGKED